MQQILKTILPFRWVTVAMLTAALFYGCSNGDQKTEAPKADSIPAAVVPMDTLKTPKDSLPPIDTSATTRPETRKTR